MKLLMAIHTGVKTLSDLFLRLLPDFWKLAVAFMDGKIQKVRRQLFLLFGVGLISGSVI